MRPLVTAFVLGAVAVALVAGAAALALFVLADAAGWDGFVVGAGPLVVLELERTPRETSATVGAGFAALAIAGGALNAAGAALLRRRARPGR